MDDHGLQAELVDYEALDEGAYAVLRVVEPEEFEIAVFAGGRRMTGSVALRLAGSGRWVLSVPGLDDAARASAANGTFLRVGSFLNILSGAYLNAPAAEDIPYAVIHALRGEAEPEAEDLP